MRVTKRTLSLAALVAGGVAAGTGVLTWVLNRGVDPVYDDDAALAGWADRLAHPPSSVEVPVDIALPKTSTGRPLREGIPLPVDRFLNVEDTELPSDADGDRFALVATTSELLLTVSKRMVRFEGGEVLPVPADPSRGFDANYKHSGADYRLREGAVAPLAYGRQRAWTLRKKLGQLESPENLLVMADRDLPCRLLAELFFTAGALYFIPHLVGERAGRSVDIGLSEQIRPDWLVRTAVLGQTFELAIPHERGVIECERGRVDERDGARFITIARRDDGYDFEALSDCARRVEKAFSHKLAYGVAPAPAVSIQDLVSTVDALRKDTTGDVEIGLDLSRFMTGDVPGN